jgi:hypothetical protein
MYSSSHRELLLLAAFLIFVTFLTMCLSLFMFVEYRDTSEYSLNYCKNKNHFITPSSACIRIGQHLPPPTEQQQIVMVFFFFFFSGSREGLFQFSPKIPVVV